MKQILFLLCAFLLAVSIFPGCATKELTPEEKVLLEKINAQLPFQVAINGNAAKTNTEIAAVISEPVPADAEIVCDTENNDLITITFMPCDKDGVVISGKAPELILIREGNKTTLDQTTDKKKLSKGFYLMDVTSGDKTSRIVIEIK